MKSDNELRTFEDLREERDRIMKDVKYDEYKQEYYGGCIYINACMIPMEKEDLKDMVSKQFGK